jgi:hypothetical protein
MVSLSNHAALAAFAFNGAIVGIERFLRRPQRVGTCCRFTRIRVQV